MKEHRLLLLILFLAISACTPPPPTDLRTEPVNDTIDNPNPMVHQQGMQIIDPEGNPIKLRGVFLEGWLQWNGTLWGAGFISETDISNRLTQLAGPEEFERFRINIYEQFITERDIEMIADLGFNVVRVPINHHILEDDTGNVTYDAIGWKYLDRLLDWCEKYDVYVVPVLHAAPGGQSPWFVADPESVKLWESEEYMSRTVAIWQAIATRYKDRTIVAGYDLLNEPDFPDGAVLIDLYIRIIEAIREVDPYHMIILEGNKLSTDFSIFSHPLSSNQVYSFHTYNLFTDDLAEDQMQQMAELAETHNVPLWNSEFGAHTAGWVTDTMAMFEDPDNHISGWVFWPWKRTARFGFRYRHLMAIPTTEAWDRVRMSIALPIDPENTISQDMAVQGMNEFLTEINAEALVIDQEMADILTNFEE